MKKMPAAALVALLLAWAGPAGADSFRCGSKLVTDGDSTAKVEALCGAPVSIERREVLQRPIRWYRGRPYYVSYDLIPVPVEYWTYNLGPNKLMRRLKFEGGLLTDVETLGHGYYSTAPAD